MVEPAFTLSVGSPVVRAAICARNFLLASSVDLFVHVCGHYFSLCMLKSACADACSILFLSIEMLSIGGIDEEKTKIHTCCQSHIRKA